MPIHNSNIIIRAEHVSKRFQLGQFISLASTLRTLKQAICQPSRLFVSKPPRAHTRFEDKGGKRYLWALRDINFELRRGERVAIIGRNGAGKSTLLKILVGIMVPTEGKVATNARIVPLMGVGAGFNPELSGRENVFLYGGILGVSPAEIRKRYEAIVQFAEISEFMDTPLKRYSKGMRARLGMGVALNLAPDVLVVDEVLAVGDAPFRQKCMDAMLSLCDEGMTLLFVSHSPARVTALCDRAILLKEGKLIANGSCEEVLKRYLEENPSEAVGDEVQVDPITGEAEFIQDSASRKGNGNAKIGKISLHDAQGNSLDVLTMGQAFHVRVPYEFSESFQEKLTHAMVNVSFFNDKAVRVFSVPSYAIDVDLLSLPRQGVLLCEIGKLRLYPGVYAIQVGLHLNRQLADKLPGAMQFVVVEGDYYNTGHVLPSYYGQYAEDYTWRIAA